METVFLKLVNLSLTASWLVLAVIALRLVFRKAPRWIFCLLWGLVALRLVCPVSVESRWSLIPSAEPLPRNMIYTEAPAIQSGVNAVDRLVNPVLADALVPTPGESVNPTQVWSFFLARIWAAGAAAMLIYAFVSYLLLRHRVATATLLRGNIRQSERVDSPFVLGVFRPVIYLPYNLADADREYAIAHEQAHIRRKDHWWKPAGFALLAVYWFNPLFWAAYVLLCRDIEAACDEKVIRSMEAEGRRAYSAALLHCSVRRRAVTACPLAFGETGVKGRIKNVMNYKKPAFWVVVLALAAAGIAAVCLLTVPERDTFELRIDVPAGSQKTYVYADEEISPTRSRIAVTSGENLGDTEVVLEPVEAAQGNGYAPVYLTPGMSAELEAEPGGWYRLGVNVQNPTGEDKVVTLKVRHVEVRIASQNTALAASEWFDYLGSYPDVETAITTELPEFPGMTFRYDGGEIIAERENEVPLLLAKGMPIWNAYFCDINGDGAPELCTTVSFGSGIIDNHIVCMDIKNGPDYTLWARGAYDYTLRLNENGQLWADQRAYNSDTLISTGPLTFTDGVLRIGGGQGAVSLTPGMTYVSSRCLYMNPFSSYGTFSDSGYRYGIRESSFDIVPLPGRGAASLAGESIPVSQWGWQKFPYTEEEWSGFFVPGNNISPIPEIFSLYGEILYQPLDAQRFLLLADGDLLLVEMKENAEMGKYVWSVYSLIDETSMGVVQWSYTPSYGSGTTFSFVFDLDYKELTASCTQGILRNPASRQTGSSLTFEKGDLLEWGTGTKNGEAPAADTAIYFTCTLENGHSYDGTLYISAAKDEEDGSMLCKATLVGAGLYLSEDTMDAIGVIRPLETDAAE